MAALNVLRDQVRADLDSLRGLMRVRGIRPNLALGTVAQIGERVGRLKPNGRALRRSPLSDLMEVEVLIDAVAAKRTGWRALEAAGISSPPGVTSMAELCRRADGQDLGVMLEGADASHGPRSNSMLPSRPQHNCPG